jgi:hypothetical protein
VPGGGVEPPRPEGRRILSPLRLPVPPSRHFVEVLDFTAYFTFSVFFIQDNDCETVQVNVKVFMDFHKSLSLACEVLCGPFRATMSPCLSNNEDIRTRFYHSMHSHSSARNIAAHFSQSAREIGHPELLWGRENRKWATRPNSPAGYTSCAG